MEVRCTENAEAGATVRKWTKIEGGGHKGVEQDT
jgi:hypothetical protein